MKDQQVAVELPETIKIGGFDYEVQLNPDLLKDGNMHGYADMTDCVIKLCPHPVAAQFANTIIHECIHAMHYNSGVYSLVDSKVEEHITGVMANEVCRFIQDNPKLLVNVFALLGCPIKLLNKKEAKEHFQSIMEKGLKRSNRSTKVVARRIVK